MTKITRTRGQWTAKVSGMGTLPVMSSQDLHENMLIQSWFTRNDRDETLARRQYEAVVRQLTAGNPERKVRAVLDGPEKERKLYEFKLAKMNVSRTRGGVVAYNYLLTDAQELAA